MTRRCAALFAFAVSVLMMGTTAHSQVNINVHIGEPPPVVLYSPPTMILMPEPQMYVAVGVPYDIYFVGGRYYYLHGGHWFWGPGYGGPWSYVVVEKLPPGLRKYKVQQLYAIRDREYKVYKVKGPAQGRYFVAEDGNSQGRGNGNGNGNGNGKGKGKGKGRGQQ